jgi:hypothetical protein
LVKTYMVIRADALPPPKTITSASFDEICRNHRVPIAMQGELRKRFDQLTSSYSTSMKNNKLVDRKRDRDNFAKVLKAIKKARKILAPTGPSGKRALSAVASRLAPMITVGSLRERFPGDGLLPEPQPLASNGADMMGRFPIRSEIRPLPGDDVGDVEQRTLDARREFVSKRPLKTISHVLETLEYGLRASIERIENQRGSSGGRKPNIYRHYVLRSLQNF